MRRSKPHRRRGVLLLIVLCVLFMFLLLAITYAVVASKERTITRNYARSERSGDPPNAVLDQIAMMIFRDTNDPHSPFRGLSLEEGIWGNVSFRGTISGSPAPQAGGQFLQFTPSVSNFNPVPNYYKGCVLTMLTGQCAGLSTHIVASTGGASLSLTVMRFQADAGLYDPANGDTFLINGRAYCGMGRGYNTAPANQTDPANNAVDPNNWPYALLPNPVGFQPSASYGSDPSGPGGANMDYTAADNNTPSLALMLNGLTVSQSGIIPSFFRPDLYTYWTNQPGSPTSSAPLLRKISFRPNLIDHPIFNANTNPSFQPGSPASTFDVDNLGGGIADSIWIDPGFPVFTTRDGRTAKILTATCILDLDGRINVNAHGSVMNMDTTIYPQTGATAMCSSAGLTAIAGLANNTPTTAIPVGQGYGVADINLNGLFSSQEVSNLILGYSSGGSTGYPGRYGGNPGSNSSGWSVVNAPLEWVKLFEFPLTTFSPLLNFDDPRILLTSFNTPPDLKGRRITVVDPRGQPVYVTPGSTSNNKSYWGNELQARTSFGESPYSFKLDRSVPRPGRYVSGYSFDDPFTVGEMETILRQYDVDNRSLPQRLYNMLPSTQPGNALFDGNKRNKFTVESWDPPSPNFQAPRNLRTGLTANGFRAYGITDLLNAKFVGPNPASPVCPGLVGNSAEIAKLLPPELIAGLRMDINRPFGNGRDDNGNGLVDEPGGISANNPSAPDASPEAEKTLAGNAAGYSSATVPFNLVNGSSTTSIGNDPVLSATLPAGHQARQLMARHLYALMMLFADQGYNGWISPTEAGSNPGLAVANSPQVQQLTARRVAQWAINVVSFRDSTSIMVPFEYHWDIYQSSYQGWLVNGDPGDSNNQKSTNGNIGLVWGCKPPDALLTESLAFHDKRIADTNWDNGNNGVVNGAVKNGTPPPDQGGSTAGTPNFDQTRIPQGSGFFEIYSTRNPNLTFAPTDLYTNLGSVAAPNWVLNLAKMAPDGNPVWRIAISKSAKIQPNYDVLTLSAKYPETTTFEPTADPTIATSNPIVAQSCQQMNVLDPSKNVPIERVIWLGSTPPSATIRGSLSPGWNAAPGAQIYYNRNGAATNVALGGYAVIGSRATTYMGATGTHGIGGTATQWGQPGSQKITIAPASITVTNPAGTSTIPTTGIKTGQYQAVGMVVAADLPPATTWTNATAYGTQNSAASGWIGFSVSEPLPAPLTVGGTSNYYPQPLSKNVANGLYDAYDDLTQTTHVAGATGFLDQPLEEGLGEPTYQQLPLIQDVVGAGLAASSGTYSDYKTAFLQRLADPNSGYDPLRNPYITVDWMPIDLTIFNGEDPSPNPNDHAKGITFASRQRGGSSPATTTPYGTPNYNIWAPIQPGDSLPATPAGGGTANFSVALNHTLGFLNHDYGNGMIAGATAGTAILPQYVGDPASPFPWITWNARPYASMMELLNVPASSPDRLLFEFTSPDTQTPGTPNPFTTANVYAAGQTNVRAPFGHLLNFFNSATSANTAGSSWNLYRALEYLQVPSRFVGCETILNPSVFLANGSGGAVTQSFLPPFNMVSNYRDPGRININTVTDPGVWNCFLNGMSAPTFQQLCDSRRCDGASGGQIINPTSLPTYFGNPFRSAAGADLVPVPQMMHNGVNATFLRAGGSTPDSATTPLFANNTSPNAFNNTGRNSYFAYQGLERMSNMLTTRSNVFGVWLTIGYFEALPTTSGAADAGHPDGYQLGEEIGSDTGEVERHRAFYIFDRSIPVGYERGQNHNVNRAILLKRYIE